MIQISADNCSTNKNFVKADNVPYGTTDIYIFHSKKSSFKKRWRRKETENMIIDQVMHSQYLWSLLRYRDLKFSLRMRLLYAKYKSLLINTSLIQTPFYQTIKIIFPEKQDKWCEKDYVSDHIHQIRMLFQIKMLKNSFFEAGNVLSLWDILYICKIIKNPLKRNHSLQSITTLKDQSYQWNDKTSAWILCGYL